MRRSNPDLDKYKQLYGEPIAATPKGANPGLQKSVLRKIKHIANEGQRLRDSALKLNNQSSTRVAELFAIANGNRGASETERIQAVCELLREFRAQRERFGRNEITGIDPLLVQGIKDWGLRIFAAKKPILALETLLGARRKRGKRASAKIADRDFEIALEIVKIMGSGMSLQKAAEVLASKYGIEPESIAKIYNREHKAAKAHIAMSEPERRG